MDENDPIYQAIDRGGGQTCDIEGVVRELAKAGYVIRKLPVDWTPTSRSERIRAAVANIINDDGGPAIDHGETIERAVCKYLQLSWTDAVRAEWQGFVDRYPELKAQTEVAKELMKEEGYDIDPICMTPGQKAFIAKVDNQEAVCVDFCMPQVMPLSSIYVNRVRLVQSAAARVAKRLAEEAVKAPPEWPITIASGETFNSIEEMEASPIEAVKEMAKMMRDAPIIDTPNVRWHRPDTLRKSPTAQTCWEYFGFAGPVNFTELQGKYREIINSIASPGAAKLVPEVHRQYQNCLKELGTAIMEGKADAE